MLLPALIEMATSLDVLPHIAHCSYLHFHAVVRGGVLVLQRAQNLDDVMDTDWQNAGQPGWDVEDEVSV